MDRMVAAIAKTGSVETALHESQVPRRTHESWLKRYPWYKKDCANARNAAKEWAKSVARDKLVFDPNRKLRRKPDFATWRREYIGRPVARHQEPVIEAMDDRTNLVVIVLGPPGSGKDVTSCDYVLYTSCDGYQKVAWIMESEKFSIRRVNQLIGPYLTEPQTYGHAPRGPDCTKPTRSLIEDYGPFQWERGMTFPDGTPVPRPRWTAEEKYFLYSKAPEAEPNLWATGINGTLYGARSDLMIISDPFTVENQRSPTARADQMAWIDGTMESRLDEAGRLIVLGTRVAAYDNYGVLLDQFTRGAHVIYENGYYQKWSNGTATVIYPAVQVDDSGAEVSYWPERFPLNDHFTRGGEVAAVADDLDDAGLMEMSATGASRERGLLGIRERKPETFQTLYQQQPPASSTGDFTEAVLNHCDDPDRTYGLAFPGEILVLGIDPARTGGAAWVMWAVNRKQGTVALVDSFYGERLGMVGLREKLLLDPINRYLPRYVCYETNYEASVLDHPDIKQALRDTSAELVLHRTGPGGYNRTDSDVGLPGMVFRMRDGTIRFPALTTEDVRKTKQLKDHFLAWDMKTAAKRTRSGQFKHIPDDLAMAAWIGFTKAQSLLDRRGKIVAQRGTTSAVQRAWGHQLKPKDEPAKQREPLDVLGLWMGGNADDS